MHTYIVFPGKKTSIYTMAFDFLGSLVLTWFKLLMLTDVQGWASQKKLTWFSNR